MIWKILFAISILLLFLGNIFSFTLDYSTMSIFECVFGLIICIDIALILGIFYSLGWEQKLFSNKVLNILLFLFVISFVLFLIISGFQTYPDLYADIQDNISAIIATAIGVLVVGFVINLFLVPFYIGLFQYKKNFESVTVAEKPYWKLFSMFSITALASFLAFALIKYTHFDMYNFIDFFVIFSCLYEIVFLIGFSWNKRIFNRLFWQVTAIPYLLLLLIVPFSMSDMFRQDFPCLNMLNTPIEIFSTCILTIIFLFVLCNYAFKKEI